MNLEDQIMSLISKQSGRQQHLKALQEAVQHNNDIQKSDQDVLLAINILIDKFGSESKAAQIINTLYKKIIKSRLQNFQDVNQLSHYDRLLGYSPSKHYQKFQNQVVIYHTKLQKQGGEEIDQTKFIIQSYPMTIFKDDLDKAQFYLKKIAAYTFIRHDSNYDYFLKELKKRGGLFKMHVQLFQKISNGFIHDTFHKITTFIHIFCKYKIKQISKVQQNMIYYQLLNSNRRIKQPHLTTFYKFIVLIFEDQCQSIEITNVQVITLYEKILSLAQRRQNVIVESSTKISKIPSTIIEHDDNTHQVKITKQIALKKEQKMVVYFLQELSFGGAKQKFQRQQGHHPQFNNSRSVQRVIHKYVQKSVRRLKDICKDNKMLPKIHSHRGNIVKQLTSSKNINIFQNLIQRLLLLSVSSFKNKEKRQQISHYLPILNEKSINYFNINELKQIINDLNKFFTQEANKNQSFEQLNNTEYQPSSISKIKIQDNYD